MPYQSLEESAFSDYNLVSIPSGSDFAEFIDPSLLSLHETPQQPTPTTVNPADLVLHPVHVGSNSSYRHDAMTYEACDGLSTKRQTSSRRALRACSTSSRMNILPSVPSQIVDQYWATYNTVHSPSRVLPPEPGLFKGFFEYDGQLNRCLLCNYSIQNQTQMIQHIAGLHFDSFQHRCAAKGCSYSSVRLADLKTHVREQHEDSGVWHKCAICETTVKHKRNYVRHVKKHQTVEAQHAGGSQITASHT